MSLNDEAYTHKARVDLVRLSGRESNDQAPGEGSIVLKVETTNKQILSLNCFMGHEEAHLFYRKITNEGSMIITQFKLGGNYQKCAVLDKPHRSLVWKEYPAFLSNYYEVNGQVISIASHPEYKDSNLLILSCGVYVYTRLTKSLSVKVGDYIQMEGRLDAHILGGVK